MRRTVVYQRDDEVEKLINIASITGLSQASVLRFLLSKVTDMDPDKLRKQFAEAKRTRLCRRTMS